MTGTIFSVKRFAVHDGDGIRTTVHFKGCPLKCVWCHNPEGLSVKKQLSLYEHKCVLCGECAKVCESHILKDGHHGIDRDKCIVCGKCQSVCPREAISVQGETVTVEELMPRLLEDKMFYDASGGGVTLSGGECLMQPDFAAELLRALKSEGIRTAVDTSGFASRETIEKVLPYTDVFLYDIKSASEEAHIKCTGQSNKIILDNLEYIDNAGAKIEIRIPFVPGYNDGEISDIAKILTELKGLTKVKLLAYHSLAGSKYDSLDLENTMPKSCPSEEELERAKDILRAHGLNVL